VFEDNSFDRNSFYESSWLFQILEPVIAGISWGIKKSAVTFAFIKTKVIQGFNK
jgi:hypothetical protein